MLWTRKACVVLALIGVAVACGDPEAPPLPTIPDDTADAGGDAATSSVDCLGKKDGTPCSGDGKICVANVCTDTSCGDGVVTPPEECDHGTANGPNTGCETSCRFSCVAGDASRDCPSNNGCIANGTCDPAKHTCTAGAPLASGASCGQYKLCVGGNCVSGACGDAVVTSPEQCDNGTANGAGKGCEADCTFTCSNAATDCTPVPCNTMSCSAMHLCAASPDTSKNGQACGGGNVCSNGACVVPGAVCGNGVKEGGEDCDFGTAGNGPNKGCEANCKFSCTTGSCVDTNACHDAPTCTAVTSNGQTGYQCVQGATKSDGTVCGTGSICLSGTCKPSTCGDGYRDPARSEQCDDGNLTNLDACGRLDRKSTRLNSSHG